MSYTHAVAPDHPLCGTWFARAASRASVHRQFEYTISVVEKEFRITGVDWASGEQIIICDVAYDGEWLRFQSLQPSTGRSGCNWMRVVDQNQIEFRFTFSDREFWERKLARVRKSAAYSLSSSGRRITPGRKFISAAAARAT